MVGNATEPVHFTTYGANAGIEQTQLRVGYSLNLAATRSEYEAVTTSVGMPPQSDRNNNAYELIADLYVGYLEQDYRVALLGVASGIDAGANVVWNPTTLTSVSLKGERTVQDAEAAVVGFTNAPGYLDSTVGVSLDHELLRNVLLNGNASYANDDFQGINRSDNDYLAGMGSKYLLNRNLYLGATCTFEHRESTGTQAANPFSRNIFMLRASTQFRASSRRFPRALPGLAPGRARSFSADGDRRF